MALIHHAFLFSETEFLAALAPLRRQDTIDVVALHAAATGALASQSGPQRELLDLLGVEPEFWLDRSDVPEPYRWIVLLLSGLPSLLQLRGLRDGKPNAFLSLRQILAAWGWDEARIRVLLHGHRLDALLEQNGIDTGNLLPRGFQSQPGWLAPDEATAIAAELRAARGDPERLSIATAAVATDAARESVAAALLAPLVLDDTIELLESAARTGSHLLVSVFD